MNLRAVSTLVDSRHRPSTSIYLRALLIFDCFRAQAFRPRKLSVSGIPRLLTAVMPLATAPMRGRLRAARTSIDVSANVCPKSVHEWDGQLQSTDFWVSGSASCRYVPCLFFFPILIIDIVNLILDFDTARQEHWPTPYSQCPHRPSNPPRALQKHMFARLRLSDLPRLIL